MKNIKTAEQKAIIAAKAAATKAAKQAAKQAEVENTVLMSEVELDAMCARIATYAESEAIIAEAKAEVKAQAEAEAKAVKTKATFSEKLLKELTARNIEQSSHDTELAIKYIEKSSVAINAAMLLPQFAEMQSSMLRKARIAKPDQNKQEYIAVKAMVKAVHVLCAIGQGFKSEIDNHTQILGYQLVKLAKVSNKTAMVVQSKRAVYAAFDTVQEIDSKHTANYELSTAGTQVSSSRAMFSFLGLCDVVKFKKDDVIVIQDNERARSFIALFA